MGAFISLEGQKFGRWSVGSRLPSEGKGKDAKWNCMCECGVSRAVNSSALRRGLSKSCGCLHSEIVTASNTKHLSCGTRAYRAWSNMKSRCLDENHPDFKHYGGRGIKVCDHWMNFENFLS